MSTRSLYAILAGINSYQLPVTPLEGCLNDVSEWKGYLSKESSSFTLNILTLQNEEVTKDALTTALQSALTNATPNDVVFFFFSGHGTRETADEIFSDIEQDNALEALVCYDSIRKENEIIHYNLLSDKELHYLISQYGKEGTHIILTFDCCHSGGITRNAGPGKEEKCFERRYVPFERENFIAPAREWNRFIFGESLTRDSIAKTGWLQNVKQKPHITLAACQNDESAFELEGKGIFTVNLIDVLRRSNGSVSYYDLQSRARLFTQNQFRQTPEVYTVKDHEDDLLRSFLDKTNPQAEFGCTVNYKNFTGWVMDLGAIHGITSYSGPVMILVNGLTYECPIGEVFSNYSRLKIPQELENLLAREQAYTASIKNHFSGNTLFFIDPDHNKEAIMNQLKESAEKWILEIGSPFSFSDSRANSSYILKAGADKLTFCQNGDSARPATEVLLNDPEAVDRTIQYMRHISQWEYVRSLCNPDFRSEVFPVRMNIYRINPDMTKQELFPKSDTIEFNYDKSSSGEYSGKLKVSLFNQSKSKYYCSVIYLSNLFQVYGNMLDSKVIGISPGETAWILNGSAIELDLENHVIDFNYEYSIFYLKLLACTKSFQVDTLEQSALPAPRLSNKKGDESPTKHKFKTREENAEKSINWFTRTLCFKGRNPKYVGH